MRLDNDPAIVDHFLESACSFWDSELPRPVSDKYVVVDCLHNDIRYVLRNLTLANLYRLENPAHLVVIAGTDPIWNRVVGDLSIADTRRLAEAYGASQVIDIHELANVAKDHRESGIRLLTGPLFDSIPPSPRTPADLRQVVDATYARIEYLPRVSDSERETSGYRQLAARASDFAAICDHMFSQGEILALVTGHLTYSPFLIMAEAAQSRGALIFNVMPMGSLKAEVLHGPRPPYENTPSEQLTNEIGRYFARIADAATPAMGVISDDFARRSRLGHDRPAWWRKDQSAAVQLEDNVEREQFRAFSNTDLGLSDGKRTIAVFNHCVSDALGHNIENFDDLAEWFEVTAAFAAQRDDVDWLFLEHPDQHSFDRTDFFQRIQEQYRSRPHMRFFDSTSLSKNMLWSVIDMGVTLRGSIAGELPAYGIPVLQVGYSPWSKCDVSIQAHSQAEYWKLLDSAVTDLASGTAPKPAIDVDRARLWMWFYRAATDINTPLVPHWDVGREDELMESLTSVFGDYSLRSDPTIVALREAIATKAPILSEVDFALD